MTGREKGRSKSNGAERGEKKNGECQNRRAEGVGKMELCLCVCACVMMIIAFGHVSVRT